MKYIGPFLKINKISTDNIKSQLYYLSKESLRQIVLYSKCGVTIQTKDLKSKNIPDFDITTFKNLSPLLCIYRKANPNLININNKLCWNDEKFKKEINIDSNALMTLCLLELCDYYSLFKDIDKNKYNLRKLYIYTCKKQLEFYALYFRTSQGVFVDKKHENSSYDEQPKFTDKSSKFDFSTQSLLMAAYYKCSLFLEGSEKEQFRNFSLDILNMLVELKDNLYNQSFSELTKLCFALNIFYSYSKDEKSKNLILDISELMFEKFYGDEHTGSIDRKNSLENDCLNYINYILIYKYLNIIKAKENADFIYKKLMNLYDPDKGIFFKNTSEKNVKFSCLEILMYLICCLTDSDINKGKNESTSIAMDIFTNQIIDSGLILSWPEAPNLNNAERYRSFSLKSEDLIEEKNFRMPSVPLPETCELAPVFAKYASYSRKKGHFKSPKISFDSYKNMFIFFLTLYVFKGNF
ncbi:MAG: hypothetical protein LKE46_00500 [Clostridium sp.]|uniref:hypothetical protein n=1 Tax=Clostridium sp. TaxID=1506 RepID=UPI0025B8CD23|nr:hypothetical protein [Clostridium sp.]MCH3962748.1 hypothetical protein [Clostridium sp.]MCI1715837.1 hypothetical protein [Clostridium sp.]MCI1799958.1 hypothetical protein [Clostridium sp.]MCI1813872.1 hypothetical protein [Clostridium sp.]MCI1870770.1 hypothetical protein [Clostridium sp.]